MIHGLLVHHQRVPHQLVGNVPGEGVVQPVVPQELQRRVVVRHLQVVVLGVHTAPSQKMLQIGKSSQEKKLFNLVRNCSNY